MAGRKGVWPTASKSIQTYLAISRHLALDQHQEIDTNKDGKLSLQEHLNDLHQQAWLPTAARCQIEVQEFLADSSPKKSGLL